MDADIRAAVRGDILAVLDLWRASAAPTSTDTPEALRLLLDRDPGALMVAEASGQIVGSVIAGWDGWRGSVSRLAVAATHQRRGLGAQLLREAEHRLRALGATRMHAIVVGSDSRAVAFWESTDWVHQSGQRRYTAG